MSRRTTEELETRYVTGQRISLRALAIWGSVSQGHCYELSRTGAWARKRREFLERVTEKAAIKRAERGAQSLAEFQDSCFTVVERLVKRMSVLSADDTIDADTIRKLSASIKDALQAGNLANGEATSIVKTIDDELTKLELELSEGKDEAL